MSVKVVAFTCVLLIYISLLPVIIGQIPTEDIPPALKFVLDPELAKWKAPEQLEKECPYYLSGFDEDNRPIWILELGVWHAHDILARGKEWEVAYYKYKQQMFVRMYESLRLRATPENPVTEVNIIVDADKYNIKQFSSIKAAKSATHLFRLLGTAAKFGNVVYLVNTNYFAELVLNFVRPVLGLALEKLEVFGTNSNIWIPKLLKLLPKDQLPPKYGGNKDFKPVQVHG